MNLTIDMVIPVLLMLVVQNGLIMDITCRIIRLKKEKIEYGDL